jgi:phage gp37-like protein
VKVIIAGSRTVTDAEIVNKAIKQSRFKITEVVSGCAKGVDTLGEWWASQNRKLIKRFPANWREYGRGAGYRRNAEMADYADALIAVWDGKSRGTKHMIDIARRGGLKVFVFKV